MPDSFLVYTKRQYPQTTPRQRKRERERRSARERGYDRAWDKLRDRFIRANPFCRFCEQRGHIAKTADHIDHIIPIGDGGKRLDPKNLQGLCEHHHNGLKQQMELYAREHGMVERLGEWCADPRTRPRRFQ